VATISSRRIIEFGRTEPLHKFGEISSENIWVEIFKEVPNGMARTCFSAPVYDVPFSIWTSERIVVYTISGSRSEHPI
jgi:hypothetical protein